MVPVLREPTRERLIPHARVLIDEYRHLADRLGLVRVGCTAASAAARPVRLHAAHVHALRVSAILLRLDAEQRRVLGHECAPYEYVGRRS